MSTLYHFRIQTLCSVEIINVEDNRASGGSDNGKSKDYIHPSNMEVMSCYTELLLIKDVHTLWLYN